MDRKPIYLEKDDEITSVVDKLKGAEAVELDVVIPKEAIMLQSVINLKLLKRQAESLGKEVTIVTQDKVGTKLAQQVGIPVVTKEGQIPKEVNMAESDEPEYSDEDIQMKEVEKEKSEPVKEKKEKETDFDESSEPPSKPTKKKDSWFKSHKKGVFIGIGFFLLAGALGAYIYVPLANINIKLAAEKKSVDISFRASKDVSDVDSEKGIIPAKEVTEEIEKKENFKATGERDVGEKASGRAKVCNKEDSDSFSLSAGTRIVDQAGLIYKTQANIQVPGASVSGGQIVEACSAEVTVSADQVGDRYNKGQAGVSFSVPALSGAYRAESTSTFTGGSSRKVKFVTAADIEKAKESIKGSAESELKSKINELVNESILLEGALETEEISATSSVVSGADAEEFTYTLKIKGLALVITENDLKALAESKFKQEIGETKEIVEADSLISSTKLTDFDFKKGEFRANLAGEAYIATKIVEDDIKNAINGESGSAAIDYLNEIEGVEEVEIKFFPRFYNRIPRVNSHIYIKTEILKTQSEE